MLGRFASSGRLYINNFETNVRSLDRALPLLGDSIWKRKLNSMNIMLVHNGKYSNAKIINYIRKNYNF